MNKRGELTSSQIIGLVLAIVGLVIVLLFFTVIDFSEGTDDEICRLSVLTRATASSSIEGGGGFVPLKCKTDKICLTDGKGECADSFAGEDPLVVKLKGSDEEKIRKIEEVSANEMFDCWSIMGEGKLDLFSNIKSSYGINPADSTCVICSRVAVDKGVNVTVLNEIDINKYMRDNQVPGSSKTYLQTLGGDTQLNSYVKFDLDGFNEFDYKKFEKEDDLEEIMVGDNPTREIAFVFMQIRAEDWPIILKNMGLAGATLAGGTFFTPVIGTIAKRVIFTPAGAVIAVIGAGAVATFGVYNAERGQTAAASYCGEFTSTEGVEKLRQGCSSVQVLSYNVGNINSLCGSIQGRP